MKKYNLCLQYRGIFFAKAINDFALLTIFAKVFILDV